jgi:hypothetical protein
MAKPRGGTRLREAMVVLEALGFPPRQRNEVAAYTLLALAGLGPKGRWSEAQSPLMGITPIIGFVAEKHGIRYAPNTRETVRDEAVKHFVEYGLLLRNPDQPDRPVTSGKTVYQLEPSALDLLRAFGGKEWPQLLATYLQGREDILKELRRTRAMTRIPVTLPGGKQIDLSPGGQNPLIGKIVCEFCPRFAPGGEVLYLGDAEDKFAHLQAESLRKIGVDLPPAAKIPDVMIHDRRRGWLLLVEAVTSAGPVDGKRRKELKALFAGCSEGLVFVTCFESRKAMQGFLSQIAWESEVWIAEDPEHLIHFNGERYLGPYPDALPRRDGR